MKNPKKLVSLEIVKLHKKRIFSGQRKNPAISGVLHPKLLSEAELLDKITISVDVCLLEVLKETTSLTNHLEKAAS